MFSVVRDGLDIGFALDRRWRFLRGEMETTKKPALLALARVLAEARVPYAVIGGVALQIHQREPRTTLGIDVAVPDRARIPTSALESSGFAKTGTFAHLENWIGPDQTPVQFTDDPALASAIGRAVEIDLESTSIRILSVGDLLHEKLRAGRDPSRRRSKRLQDLADAESLLEQAPALAAELTADERAVLDRLPK